MRRILTIATALLALNSGAATFPIVYSFTNTLWYTNTAADPQTVVSVVVQTTGAVQNALTISTFQGGDSNLEFTVASTTNFRAAVWASATNDYAVKLFTGDRLYIAQTFTNRAFATISLLTSPDSSSGGGSVRVIANGVTNSAAGAIIMTGDAIGAHTQSGSNSTINLRTNPTNLVSEMATLNDLTWDSTLFTSPEDFRAGYVNGASSGIGTDPGTPRGIIVLTKSGSGDDYTISTRFIYGVNGAVVTNDPDGNTVINGGNTTGGTVEAFFPKSNTAGVGRLFFSAQASPNNYTYLDLQSTNSGAIFFDGTNLYLGSFLISTASNSALFAGFLPAYYQDAQRLTNLVVMEDGATIATSLLGINGGTNVTLAMETWTNSSGTVGQRVTISAGSGGSNYLLNSVNTWTESNSFQKTLIAPQITLNGPGRSMSGMNATVGIRGTNVTASGAHATAAGGRSTTASGDDSTVGGGSGNSASGSGATAAGGAANSASGAYSSIPGGYGNTASGDYSLAAIVGSTASGLRSTALGAYLNAAGTDTVVIGIGQASTNQLTRYGPRRVYIDSYQTNMGLSVATTNATHAVEVGGTVRATAFLGDGSGLSGLPSTAVTGVLTTVIYTNYDLLYLTPSGGLQLYMNTNVASSVTDAVSRIVAAGVTSSPTLVRFVASGSSVSQVVAGSESTVYLPTGGGGGGSMSVTSTYGVLVVGSDTNTTIVDPGSASNLVMMSSGAGFIPQFRTHPWASSGSVASAVGALSNAMMAQTWASTASVVSAAQSANSTSVNGQAWGSSPGIGDIPVYLGAAGWSFTSAPPSIATGSVSGISAGGNILVGIPSIIGGAGVTIASGGTLNGAVTISVASVSASARATYGTRFEGSTSGGWAYSFPPGIDDISTDATTNYDAYAAFIYTSSTNLITNVLYGAFSPPVSSAFYPLKVRANQAGAVVVFTATDGATATASTQTIATANTTYTTNVVLPATSVTNFKVAVTFSTTNSANIHRIGFGP